MLVHHLLVLTVYIHQVEGTLYRARDVRGKWQLKKRVDGCTTCIYSSNTRWGYDGALLTTMFFYVTKKRGFARTCFTGKKDVFVGKLNVISRKLKQGIVLGSHNGTKVAFK